VFLVAVLSATSGAAAPLQLQLPSWLVMHSGTAARTVQHKASDAKSAKRSGVERKAETGVRGTLKPFGFPLESAPAGEAEQAQLCSAVVNEARFASAANVASRVVQLIL
jgi:hypothetical protein